MFGLKPLLPTVSLPKYATVDVKKLLVRGSEMRKSWVTKYYLTYSRDSGGTFECYEKDNKGQCKVATTGLN